MTETAVDLRKKEQVESARQLLDKMKPEIAKVLPKQITPERMARIALTAMRKNPKLLECSAVSVAGAIMTAAELGLEPSGPIGHGALIPYWNNRRPGGAGYECQFQPMYQGLLDLARRSGFIKDVQLRAVYEGDTYSYRFGLDPDIQHVPLQGPGADDPNRKPTNVYAIIRLTSGGVQWDQMSYAQAVAHGKRYSPSWDAEKQQFKSGSVWADNPLPMCLKTIMKVVLKLCPKSPQLAAVLLMDDAADLGRTSTMRKMEDGVFDVDFGDEPEEEQRPTSNALDGIVEKERQKKEAEDQAAKLTAQLEESLKKCDDQDFSEIETLAHQCGIFMKEVEEHITKTMGFDSFLSLTKGRKPEVIKWIQARRKK